jgi:hypothetical protein
MRPTDDVVGCELHTLLSKPKDVFALEQRMRVADIILHIPVEDNYSVEIARSSTIAALRPNHSYCVPMLFFEGLHPDIKYVGTTGYRAKSPMGDYNSRIVLRSFLLGLSVADARILLTSDEEYRKLGYYEKFETSLTELARRDFRCVVGCSDIVQELVREIPIFYTVNHPMNILVQKLIVKVFNYLNLDFEHIPAVFLQDTLGGGPVWPVVDCVAREHKLKYGSANYMKTNEGGQVVISFDEFVEKSYYIYSRVAERLLSTPQVQQELASLGI